MDDLWMVGLLREAADMIEAEVESDQWQEAAKTAAAAAFVAGRLAEKFHERDLDGVPWWLVRLAQRIEVDMEVPSDG